MQQTNEELQLKLKDKEWPNCGIDHQREIVRAIVIDDEGFFYFVRADRDDDFGRAITIETAGGGVEEGERLDEAILRELHEELGAQCEIVCKIGVVTDFYNLIHRKNINNYYLCKVNCFGEKHLTKEELYCFHISTLKLTYIQAVAEYYTRSSTKLGKLLANRELPILKQAKLLLDNGILQQ